MRVFIGYALRETFKNLSRNVLMTVAAILTVTVSLLLVGSALLVKQTAAHTSIVWEQQTRVTVWMKPHATDSQVASIRNQLASDPDVTGTCKFQTKQESYAQVRLITPPNIFEHFTIDSSPTAFLCVPKIPQDATIMSKTYRVQPGVYDVTAPSQQIKQMEHVIRVIQIVMLVLALILFVSAVVLILNTIQLAIFARRREVTVMKLVGATNWFIRLPFIAEGFIQGLVGSMLSVGTIFIVRSTVTFNQQFNLPLRDWIGSSVIVVLLGVTIGSVGSAFAIRRFLDA